MSAATATATATVAQTLGKQFNYDQLLEHVIALQTCLRLIDTHIYTQPKDVGCEFQTVTFIDVYGSKLKWEVKPYMAVTDFAEHVKKFIPKPFEQWLSWGIECPEGSEFRFRTIDPSAQGVGSLVDVGICHAPNASNEEAKSVTSIIECFGNVRTRIIFGDKKKPEEMMIMMRGLDRLSTARPQIDARLRRHYRNEICNYTMSVQKGKAGSIAPVMEEQTILSSHLYDPTSTLIITITSCTERIPNPSEEMKIYVKTTKKTMTLMVCPNDYIDYCKTLIHDQGSIPPNQQCLTFIDQYLQDDKTLQQYGIQNGTTICMKSRGQATGGMFHYTSGRNGFNRIIVSNKESTQKLVDVMAIKLIDTKKIKSISIATLESFLFITRSHLVALQQSISRYQIRGQNSQGKRWIDATPVEIPLEVKKEVMDVEQDVKMAENVTTASSTTPDSETETSSITSASTSTSTSALTSTSTSINAVKKSHSPPTQAEPPMKRSKIQSSSSSSTTSTSTSTSTSRSAPTRAEPPMTRSRFKIQ